MKTPLKDQIDKKIQAKLMAWYAKHHRNLPWRNTRDPYRIWVSEVMLQQTRVAAVIPYYLAFIKKFPRVNDLAVASEREVLKAWEGLGYYSRVRNLRAAAGIVTRTYHGVVPEEYEAFRKLPGVGDYIAAAVLSISFGHPLAVVDGNVKRVLARLYEIQTPTNQSSSYKIYAGIADRLLERRNPGLFNQAVMELGALVCTPKTPTCPTCPLSAHCRAFGANRVSHFPLRVEKKPVPHYFMVAGVIEKKGKVLIVQRNSTGLLGGLWEFPGGKVADGEATITACEKRIRDEVHLTVRAETFICRVNHAYTHFKITLDVYGCSYASGRVRLKDYVDFQWARLTRLGHYPFSGAHLKFIPALLAAMPVEKVGSHVKIA